MSSRGPDRRPRVASRSQSRDRSEAGFTLIEVLVAMLVSLIVIGAMATTFVKNSDSSLAGQRQAQLYGAAQLQIENIRNIVSQHGFSALALTGKPAAASDCSGQCAQATLPASPSDPNDFVMSWSSVSPAYLIETNYNHPTEGLISNANSSGEPLEINGYNTTGGLLAPATTGVAVGGSSPPVTATVYTYVTQAAIPCNSTGLGLACAADDARRVTVAVALDNPSGSKSIGPNTPVYLSTVFSNPIPSNQPSSATGLRLGLNIG